MWNQLLRIILLQLTDAGGKLLRTSLPQVGARSCSKAHSLNIVKRTRDVTDAKHDSSQAVDRTLELHIEDRHGHTVDIQATFNFL